ncbi:MAG TPA: oxidoreductase [Planctomycetaceae bacterium]|nr:oxidoreductase [Planctomycetaceae bacterium]
MSEQPSRRNFVKTSGLVAASGAALSSSIAGKAHAGGSDEIRIALVGCGGRGRGAAENLFKSGGNVKLVAVADAFPKGCSDAIRLLSRRYADMMDVPEDRMFSGLDAYKQAIDVDCDLVVIATPPAFKPQQFEYAVEKGRHIFCEKPVASDAPGVRRFMAAVRESKKKNLLVGIGLQRRHENQYKETIARIHDGAIGDVIAQRVYWNGGGIWWRSPQEAAGRLGPDQELTEMAFQCFNWYHFNWLCGDQICEQHIHNLDVGCWVKGEYPVECNGMGGGEMRMDGDRSKSQIFDHTFCEYTFADGTKMFSQGRHLKGSWTHVGEAVHGSNGTANPAGEIMGPNAFKFAGERQRGHQQEQNDLVATLAKGDIYNEGEYGAKSTFTAILGREACYSGKIIKWDELLENGRDLCPDIDNLTLDSEVPESARKGADGLYKVPEPGKYSPFA